MVQVSYRNSYGKVPENERVQVPPPPLVQTGVKSSLGSDSRRKLWVWGRPTIGIWIVFLSSLSAHNTINDIHRPEATNVYSAEKKQTVW